MRRALISVSDKTGIVEFASGLRTRGFELISTGGTALTLERASLPVLSVSTVTGFPEMLDGRVKTLHPHIHGGILARRSRHDDLEAIARLDIAPIDVVVVNLYPFVKAAQNPETSFEDLIEQIDIGGPSLVRAAAKNFADVMVVVSPDDYDAVLDALARPEGPSPRFRFDLARKAFAHTARYDTAIASTLSTVNVDGDRFTRPAGGSLFPDSLSIDLRKVRDLRYGENPHQRGALYTEVGARGHVLSRVSKEHGKDLSFNNVLDLDSARSLLADLDDPACVIVKHNNPCGAAEGESALDAYEKALACDPLSAYGGVIALNRPIDEELARRLHENFVEVLIAPGYEGEAMAILQQKQAIRILENTEQRLHRSDFDMKRVRGGMLVQELDGVAGDREGMTVETGGEPSELEWLDIAFAWKVCKHVRSNAIVLVKNRQTIGIGAGQMSRVDSVRLAIEKCRAAFGEEADARLNGCVVASDAFFPFADGPQAAVEAGARTVVQPGGSKRDDEVIAACEKAGVTMVFTGRRHFRH